MTLELVIGNKNYSSWSFRPWLAMTVAGIPFAETLVRLGAPFDGQNRDLLEHSPSGKVPVLKSSDGLVIWESLAILEYLAEKFPDAGLWPSTAEARADARAISAEMHGGFGALRDECPMNMRRPVKSLDISEAARNNVNRIVSLWKTALAASGGPYLFGAFSNADAMYAPVVNRLHVYDLTVDADARSYMETMMALPAWLEWEREGRAEPWTIPEDEA